MVRAEKEDPNLITVFICFLRSGLRFTRTDTNNVGLAFIEELKRLNPEFKPVEFNGFSTKAKRKMRFYSTTLKN